MRKAVFPVAFISLSTLAACSFQMQAGSKPNQPATPTANQPAASTPAAASTTPPAKGRPIGRNNYKIPTPISSNTSAPTAPTVSPVPPAPSGIPVVAGTTPFGNGTADVTGYKGSLFWVPAGTTKLPQLGTMTPNGVLFTKELNVASRAFTEGFPGVDATRKENFAIRYEAPLVVENEADYDFRLVSDDGTILLIDGTPIVDNDGTKTAAAEKTGPVHLVKGTHVITVDYFQSTGNVALQLFCKKTGETTDKVCPLKL